jgi:hypothetical protein
MKGVEIPEQIALMIRMTLNHSKIFVTLDENIEYLSLFEMEQLRLMILYLLY